MALYNTDFDPMTSLFSEGSSLWAVGQDDFLKGQGSSELGGSAGNLADDLLGGMDGQHSRGSSLSEEFPEWMSEKISLTQWIDAADIMPSDLLTTVPLSFPKNVSIEPAEELLQTLMVDDSIPPQPPSPGEQQAPDLLALSPAECLNSPDSPMSPASQSNTELPSLEAADLTAEEQLWQIAEGLTTMYKLDISEGDHDKLAALQPESPYPESSPPSPHSPPSQQIQEVNPKTDQITTQSNSRVKPKLKTVNDPSIKKSKKRDQNKVAATRYRQKKRIEADFVVNDQMKMEEKNKELKDKVESLSREIKYLKDLMAEVYKVKGELKILRK